MEGITSPLVVVLANVILAGIFIWRDSRRDKTNVNEGTIRDLQSALEAKELVISNFQVQIDSLQAQIKQLQDTNKALQDVVTGKDLLLEIQKTLTPIPSLFAPGGILEKFHEHDLTVLGMLKEIRQSVVIDAKRRSSDHKPSKRNRA